MTKQEIRNQYLELRKALIDTEYNQLNQNLSNIFLSTIDLSAVKTLHIFLPIISKKEPNTWLIIDRLKKELSNIQISVPKMKDDNTLINFYFEGPDQIKNNKWNIPEPQSGEITPTDKIDLVIVPLLAFDLTGNRVGYGKGFYDRFLKECRMDCKKVGLSLFDPVEMISDINVNDVRLTHCITPERTYTF
ncbi:MAG TPA: 5-formyltetrahydrofolate cyclo-ligase [Cyclobacteriaceae bacterium]|jgi:5-formyltetrahydrofolate cyclo-ligase|nr:5-formyltetrahydrofolate cyclo-ligase [Cyclobacteriaceae bacterium]